MFVILPEFVDIPLLASCGQDNVVRLWRLTCSGTEEENQEKLSPSGDTGFLKYTL